MAERTCRECGCTETNACVAANGRTCGWLSEDLCTHCAGSVLLAHGLTSKELDLVAQAVADNAALLRYYPPVQNPSPPGFGETGTTVPPRDRNYPRPGDPCWCKFSRPDFPPNLWYAGTFITWGIDYEPCEQGAGSFTVAIVALSNGELQSVPPDRLKFTEPNHKPAPTPTPGPGKSIGNAS